MPYPQRFLTALASAALLCASTLADTVILTTGEKIEGKVIGETATELTIEIKVSASVTDQTTVPKDKVLKIEKAQPDELSWQAVKNLKLAPNSLPAAQYNQAMGPLRSFANEFPNSAHAPDAKKILAAFEEEKKRVEAGEVRLGEKWLSKDEVAKERYQINGMLAAQYMRGQIAAGDLIGALNSFDQIEKTYPGSSSYPDAVEAARGALAMLKTIVQRAQDNYKFKQAEFEQGVAAATREDKPELLAARQRELAQAEAALAAADKAKVKWPVLMVRSDKNLAAIAQKIPSEEQRLARLDLSKFRQSVQLAEQAKVEIASKDLTAAQDTLRKATDLWSTNELATRLKPQLADLKASAKATPTSAAAPAKIVEATPEPKKVEKAKKPVSEAPVQSEPEKPFFLTIGGMITAVIILALAVAGAIAFKKIKGRASDVLE